MNTLLFVKSLTYDIMLVVLLLVNCKRIGAIGVITLGVTVFEFAYYIYPYIVLYQCFVTQVSSLMLIDHPKLFPDRKLMDMQSKFLKLQQANIQLAKKCDKQEEIKEMITFYE